MKIEVTDAMAYAALKAWRLARTVDAYAHIDMRIAIEAALAAMPERGGEAVMWQVRIKYSDGTWSKWLDESKDAHDAVLSGEDYHEYGKAEARALYATPTAPVRDGEWSDKRCIEFMCVTLRHVEYAPGTKGPTCDDIRLGVKMATLPSPDAAVAMGGEAELKAYATELSEKLHSAERALHHIHAKVERTSIEKEVHAIYDEHFGAALSPPERDKNG